MTSDITAATSNDNGGTGQDQSDVFRGVSPVSSARRANTEIGISAKSVPAFVAGEELAELADYDPRIVVMTADLASANRLIDFKVRHPDRFFNMGIAEKNMITAGAGLASTGLMPFVGTFASFASLLGYEQIRTDCAYPGMPVQSARPSFGYVTRVLRLQPPRSGGHCRNAGGRRSHGGLCGRR